MQDSFFSLHPLLKSVIITQIFLVFLFLPALKTMAGNKWKAKVDYVLDGDTFYLSSGQKIRLKSIDAPEMPDENSPGQFFSLECRKRLKDLIKNKVVSIESSTLGADHYGRILAYVWLPENSLLNKVLLEKGLAFYFFHPKDRDDGYQQKLLSAQQRAMNSRLGFWARILSMPNASKNFIGNKRSKRFHTLQCGYGKRISKQNKVVFLNLRQAFYAGFAPGRRCTPWPNK